MEQVRQLQKSPRWRVPTPSIIKVHDLVQQEHLVIALLDLICHDHSLAEAQGFGKADVCFFVELELHEYLASDKEIAQ